MILLCYRQLFVKGDVFISEWGIFGVELFLCYSPFFVKGDFIIGGVECTYIHSTYIYRYIHLCNMRIYVPTYTYAPYMAAFIHVHRYANIHNIYTYHSPNNFQSAEKKLTGFLVVHTSNDLLH